METVSIIIPTWNNPEYLIPCLRSICIHHIPEQLFHIYVVDNGTTRVNSFLPDDVKRFVTVIEAEKNLGWEGGLKLGLQYVPKEVEFIMFANDDIYIPQSSSHWLYDMLQWFRNPQIGIVGPTSNVVMGAQNIFTELSVPAIETEILIGFTMLIRKKALEEAGGIDDTLPGGDDFDLSIRMIDAGYKMIIDRNIFVFHHGFKTGERLHGNANVGGGWNSYEMYQRTNLALIKKHGFARWQRLTMNIGYGKPIVANVTAEDTEGKIIRSYLSNEKKVYELGCGAQLTVPHAIGVDRIKTGESIGTIRGESVASIQTDVSQPLPFHDAEILIARHILEHMLNPIETLINWKRALKKGGKLIVAVPDDEQIISIPMNREHKHAYTKNFAKELFTTVGFSKIEVKDGKNHISFVIKGENL